MASLNNRGSTNSILLELSLCRGSGDGSQCMIKELPRIYVRYCLPLKRWAWLFKTNNFDS